jgi:hypothetical protein
MVSLLGFINVGSDGNHDFGGSFCHFGNFFILNSFEEGIYLAVFLIPIGILHQQFYLPLTYCRPGERGDKIPCLCQSSGGRG